MKRAIIYVGLVVGLIVGSLYATQNEFQRAKTDNQPISKDQVQIPPPKKLIIPKLGVDSNVEKVGLTSSGAMDVPKRDENVGWYELGYKPGDKGNAVVAGHFDSRNGSPAVFYNIEKLEPGDEIIVIDEQNKEKKFRVTQKERYPFNNFPLKQVFGELNKERLNLITCDGVWNGSTYSDRLVIFSELES